MAKNSLSVEEVSILALIAENPEISRERMKGLLKGLTAEAKRVGSAMKELHEEGGELVVRNSTTKATAAEFLRWAKENESADGAKIKKAAG